MQDKVMLYLVLVVAFFVGGAATEVFSDHEVEAETNIINTQIVEDLEFVLSDTFYGDGEKYPLENHLIQSVHDLG